MVRFGNVIGRLVRLLGSELASELTNEIGIELTPENIIRTLLRNEREFKELVKNYILSKVQKKHVGEVRDVTTTGVTKVSHEQVQVVGNVVEKVESVITYVPHRLTLLLYSPIVEINPVTWNAKVHYFFASSYFTIEVNLREGVDTQEVSRQVLEKFPAAIDENYAGRIVENIGIAVLTHIDVLSILYGLEHVKKLFNFDNLFDEVIKQVNEKYLPFLLHIHEIGQWGKRLYTEGRKRIPIEFKKCIEIGKMIDLDVIKNRDADKLLEVIQENGDYAVESTEKLLDFIMNLAEEKKVDTIVTTVKKLKTMFNDMRVAFLYKVYLQLLLNGFESGGIHRLAVDRGVGAKTPPPTFLEILNSMYLIDEFVSSVRGG